MGFTQSVFCETLISVGIIIYLLLLRILLSVNVMVMSHKISTLFVFENYFSSERRKSGHHCIFSSPFEFSSSSSSLPLKEEQLLPRGIQGKTYLHLKVTLDKKNLFERKKTKTLQLCSPLNRITLGQHKIDIYNRTILLINVFCALLRYKWACNF